jgi:RNA polymerase sigma-70 factor (ECF subfamily)
MADPASQRPTRPSLLLRLRDPRDGEAWEQFVAVYGPLIYGHGRRKGLGHEDAEDLTQRLFAQIARSIRSFTYRPELGRFRDWLGTSVRHEIGRILKRKERQEEGKGGHDSADLLDAVAAPAEDGEWEAAFNAHVLQAALARCRPHFEEETWRAFERVWLEDRPAADVAAEFGRRVGWVYVARARVLKRLWQEVKELADDACLGLAGPADR